MVCTCIDMEELLASYPELQQKRNIVSGAKSSHSTHSPFISSSFPLSLFQVQCSLSGHEMPARLDVVRAYVEGKKFQKLKAENDFNFERLEPFIKPSLKRKWVEFSQSSYLCLCPSILSLSVHPSGCGVCCAGGSCSVASPTAT